MEAFDCPICGSLQTVFVSELGPYLGCADHPLPSDLNVFALEDGDTDDGFGF